MDNATSEAKEAVKVTQGDERAAYSALHAGISLHHDVALKALVQAFARHRAEAEKRIVDWLRSKDEGALVGWRPEFLAELIERGDHVRESDDGK